MHRFFLCALFLVTFLPGDLCDITITQYYSSDQLISFTPSYDYGEWTITVTKTQGSGIVLFCTGSAFDLGPISTYDSTTTLSSNDLNADTVPCGYIKNQAIQFGVTGLSTHNVISITWTDTSYNPTTLNVGSENYDGFGTSQVTKYYNFSLASAPSNFQVFFVPLSTKFGNYYTLTVSMACQTQKFYDRQCTSFTTLDQSNSIYQYYPCFVFVGCSPPAGTYIISVSPQSVPNNDNFAIIINTFNPLNTTAIDQGTSYSAPLHETTFFTYNPSASATSSTTYDITYQVPYPFEGSLYYGIDPTFCSYQEEFQGEPFDFQPCAVTKLYFAFSPTGNNRYATVINGLILQISESNTETTDISLGTEYFVSEQELLSDWVLSAIPASGYILVNLTYTQIDQQVEFSIGRGSQCNSELVSYSLPSCKISPCIFPARIAVCDFSQTSGDVYLTFTTPISFLVTTVDATVPSSSTLTNAKNVTATVGHSQTMFYPFNNILPSFLTVTVTSNESYAYISQTSSSTTYCLQGNSYTVESGSPVRLLVVCPTSGMIQVYSDGDTVDYELQLKALTTYDLTVNTPLKLGPFLPTAGVANFVLQFTLSMATEITFSVQYEQEVEMEFYIIETSVCSSVYSCYDSYCDHALGLLAGEYYIIGLADSTASVPFNVFVNVTEGNANCRDISSELHFCAGQLSGSNGYTISVFAILGIETDVSGYFLEFESAWPNTCNASILNYVCNAFFEQYQCTSTGSLQETQVCTSDCLSTLNAACGQNTLCATPICSAFSNYLDDCPQQTPYSNGEGGLRSFWVLALGVIFFGVVL